MRPLIWAVIALAADDGGVVLVGDDLLGAAQVSEDGGLQLAAGLFGDHRGAGEGGDILQHGLAAVAKAGGFDGQHVEHAAQFVQHQGRQGFAVNILSDDDQLALADLDQFLQQRDDVLGGGDLLVVDQDVGLVDGRLPCARGR